MPNRDKTMDDIKNEKGITYETFTYHGEKRSNREQ